MRILKIDSSPNTCASNFGCNKKDVTDSIPPLRSIGTRYREKDFISCMDVTQSAGAILIDLWKDILPVSRFQHNSFHVHRFDHVSYHFIKHGGVINIEGDGTLGANLHAPPAPPALLPDLCTFANDVDGVHKTGPTCARTTADAFSGINGNAYPRHLGKSRSDLGREER